MTSAQALTFDPLHGVDFALQGQRCPRQQWHSVPLWALLFCELCREGLVCSYTPVPQLKQMPCSCLYRRSLTRPKSFVSTRLLSLEEAQARTQAPLLLQGAPLSFQGKFHTVLDLPPDRRKRGMKVRKSAGGSWKTFFAIGKPAGSGRRKPMRISSLFQPAISHAGIAPPPHPIPPSHTGCRVDSVTLRSAKSEESLSSQHSGAGQCKLQRLRRPRSSSDGLALAASMEPQLLPPSRSYDSLLPEEARDHDQEEDEEEEDDDEEDEEGVYMLPDFSQDPASAWMAEDVIDFSPTFLEDGPIGLGGGGGRGQGVPARCHTPSLPLRGPPKPRPHPVPQPALHHRGSGLRAQPIGGSGPSKLDPGCRSSAHTVVHALSPKAPKSPPLDISDPIAISVPAKVLEMIGGRAGELQPGTQGASSAQPPQMISMLLRSCDFQLTESCQQEIRSKLGPDPKVKGFMLPAGPSLPSQQPPPPPPKNPARLMALALAESANKALRQGASPPYRPPQPKPQDPLESRFMRSVSVDAGEVLSGSSPTDANQLYSTVRPLSVWMSEGESNTNAVATAADASEAGEQPSGRSPGQQDTGTLSSETSVSDSGGSNSEVTASSSSGETDPAPSPVYKNQEDPPDPPRGKPGPPPFPEDREPQAQRKPPAYSRQFSAPHLQQKGAPQSHSQLLHSKSECSPLAQLRAFQPARPKVPPKPQELAPQRAPLSRADNYMRRSLDAARIRRLITQSQGGSPGTPPNPPLSRAFSERLSGTTGYHAARATGHPVPHPAAPQPSQIRPVAASSSADDQGKVENFYYEISGPEHPQAPPSYAWHSYQNMRLELEGNYRPSHAEASQRPLSRGHSHPLHAPQGTMVPRAPQLWSSEATRAWAAAHLHSHSHSFSHAHSHSHPQDGSPVHPPQHRHPHPHPHRHASSSVRLPRADMHPALMSSAPSTASALPLSVHKPQRGGAGHASHRSPSADLSASQLHPYFENGKSWLTTDLDGDAQQVSEPPALPPEPPPEGRLPSPLLEEQESPLGPEPAGYESPPRADTAKDALVSKATPPAAAMHYRSRSDPQSSGAGPGLTGKEIASLLIERLAEDEGDEGPSHQHQPAYNVYTPGPSRSRLEGGQVAPSRGGSFHRQDPLRRSSSSGGQYRQAFDVMPSGDQVLKFYRPQDFPNPYPSRPLYQDSPYPNRSPQDPHPNFPAPSPSDGPSSAAAAFSHVLLGAPRGYGSHAGGFQMAAPPPQYGQYQFQPVPVLAQYPQRSPQGGGAGGPLTAPARAPEPEGPNPTGQPAGTQLDHPHRGPDAQLLLRGGGAWGPAGGRSHFPCLPLGLTA
ncbi:hypothetical protein SKAU_G00419270 [Synaphobranchus kaupii]|uniref:Uncharacterized protein n=1 Tax=Synaphobranchus kaupii TaxID=118154 RepID=A0A9Q1IAZ3_SYNKA|nr:hypothetical protein SKAU_G00419270 [Synaphobranchus kaupii]